MSVLLAILLQVGAAPMLETHSPVPDELYEQRRRSKEAALAAADETSAANKRLAQCIARTEIDPQAARTEAADWFDRAELTDKAAAAQCRGMALAELGQWDEAAAVFTTGRDSVAPGGQLYRAQLGAMAGNSLLSAGQLEQALSTLVTAQNDAEAADNGVLKGEIALDRARVLVALGREQEADTVLTLARLSLPNSGQAWLLSATLSRRLDNLDAAQQQIRTAAELAPTDPEVGLEAGVIAVLSGNVDAARKSWESVLKTAPDTPFAETARGYLEQIANPDTAG